MGAGLKRRTSGKNLLAGQSVYIGPSSSARGDSIRITHSVDMRPLRAPAFSSDACRSSRERVRTPCRERERFTAPRFNEEDCCESLDAGITADAVVAAIYAGRHDAARGSRRCGALMCVWTSCVGEPRCVSFAGGSTTCVA